MVDSQTESQTVSNKRTHTCSSSFAFFGKCYVNVVPVYTPKWFECETQITWLHALNSLDTRYSHNLQVILRKKKEKRVASWRSYFVFVNWYFVLPLYSQNILSFSPARPRYCRASWTRSLRSPSGTAAMLGNSKWHTSCSGFIPLLCHLLGTLIFFFPVPPPQTPAQPVGNHLVGLRPDPEPLRTRLRDEVPRPLRVLAVGVGGGVIALIRSSRVNTHLLKSG